jgi:hypothetical protein
VLGGRVQSRPILDRSEIVKIARSRAIREDTRMLLIALGAIGLGGVFLIYQTVRPMMRRRRKYDPGVVSDYWISQQRGRSSDATR